MFYGTYATLSMCFVCLFPHYQVISSHILLVCRHLIYLSYPCFQFHPSNILKAMKKEEVREGGERERKCEKEVKRRKEQKREREKERRKEKKKRERKKRRKEEKRGGGKDEEGRKKKTSLLQICGNYDSISSKWQKVGLQI